MKKTVLITGVSGNLGRALLENFLGEGYHVAGTVLPGDPFGYDDPGFEKSVTDLADEGQAADFVSQCIARYGIIDAAILTVGGFAMGKMADTSIADIKKQYSLNFETAFNVAKPVFAQMMKQNNGRIFLIGSKPGLDARNGKGMIAYSLAKSLLFRLADLMNEEARGKNVVTAVVIPSTIDTPENRKSMPTASHESWVSPESISRVISFYCSPEAAILREPLLKVYNNA